MRYSEDGIELVLLRYQVRNGGLQGDLMSQRMAPIGFSMLSLKVTRENDELGYG